MNKNDFDKFALIWRATTEYYNQALTDGSLALTFRNLEKYALLDIEHAINQHIQDTDSGKFAPKVADIIKHIEASKHDGRLSSDEAWSIAIQSFDEYTTVVTNDEIAGALQTARHIYHEGDKIGARMAFKSAYERMVEDARVKGTPVKWWPSYGFSVEGREIPIREAIARGYLSKHALKLAGLPYEPADEKLIEVMKESPIVRRNVV